MKRIIVYLFVGLAITLGGCEKYLAKEPDNRAKLTDPGKVSQLLGSAYPLASYMAFTEAMSDVAGDKGEGSVQASSRDPFYFADVRADDQDSPDYYWNACYQAVAAANEALVACNTASKPDDYKKQKGEALLARAYAHFMLVTLFAKPYDAATAGSSPGIPYVTEPETVVIKQYDRRTVAYVYEMIEKDLLEGLPLIDDAVYDVPRYHFNRAAANAFAARFYLYKKDYPKVVAYANASVPNFLPNLRPWNTVYQTTGLNELPALYQKSSEPANLLLVSVPSRYCYNYFYATTRYGLTVASKAEIFNTSITVTGGAWVYNSAFVGSQANPAIPKLYGRDFAYSSPSSDFGLQYGTITLLSVEEVLFNKCEANAYIGNYNDAIADLNTYVSTRLLATGGVSPGVLPAARQITQAKLLAHYGNTLPIRDALVNYVLELKRLEYIHEGMRWFDMLRYNIRVKHLIAGPSGSGLYTDSVVVQPTDKRRQLKLPDGVKLSGITDLNR
jgi:starch-binding outer membrane protein, SusD/RagB family